MNTPSQEETLLFANLPVESVERTREFFSALGFSFDPLFSGQENVCMKLSSMASVMFLQRQRFADFTPRTIANAHETSEVLMCVSRSSREDVDTVTEKALSMGAKEVREPQEHGFMYGRSVSDPDGHIWEFMWMDIDQFPGCSAESFAEQIIS